MEKELNNLKRLYSIESAKIVILKEKDIDSLSLLLFSNASYEYITGNLLSKRKFNTLNKLGVFENVYMRNNKMTYMISSKYENQIKNIFIKYYGTKYMK